MGEDEIQEVESEIGNRMPEPLRQLLLTDGVPEGFLGESYIRFFSAGEISEWLVPGAGDDGDWLCPVRQ
jgi:hypothetical protein